MLLYPDLLQKAGVEASRNTGHNAPAHLQKEEAIWLETESTKVMYLVC